MKPGSARCGPEGPKKPQSGSRAAGGRNASEAECEPGAGVIQPHVWRQIPTGAVRALSARALVGLQGVDHAGKTVEGQGPDREGKRHLGRPVEAHGPLEI